MSVKQRILITGGAGSLGLTLCNRWINQNYDRIVVYSTDEAKHVNLPAGVISELGDVRDKDRLNTVCRAHRIDTIIAAGALKRVDTLEHFATEAYQTNVVGTHNIAEVAIHNNISKCLLIGTDKLVDPCNSYGFSKALARAIFTQYAQYGYTVFGTVLYPNVIASRGSIVPLWRDQIKSRQIRKITHMDCTRFLFTLDDAVNLIELALSKICGGETIIPVIDSFRMIDVHKALCGIFNGDPEDIECIGLRPGEKLHEAMCNKMELNNIYHVTDSTLTILPSINTKVDFSYKNKKYVGPVVDSANFINDNLSTLQKLLNEGMKISPY